VLYTGFSLCQDQRVQWLYKKEEAAAALELTRQNEATARAIPLPFSALAIARNIEDLKKITYPDGIRCPNAELNDGPTKGGKFMSVIIVVS